MQNIKTESGIDTTLSFFILLRAVSKINDRIPLLSVATPACFAGNCKPDPPPSPRLGGGCVPRLCLGRSYGHDPICNRADRADRNMREFREIKEIKEIKDCPYVP